MRTKLLSLALAVLVLTQAGCAVGFRAGARPPVVDAGAVVGPASPPTFVPPTPGEPPTFAPPQ